MYLLLILYGETFKLHIFSQFSRHFELWEWTWHHCLKLVRAETCVLFSFQKKNMPNKYIRHGQNAGIHVEMHYDMGWSRYRLCQFNSLIHSHLGRSTQLVLWPTTDFQSFKFAAARFTMSSLKVKIPSKNSYSTALQDLSFTVHSDLYRFASTEVCKC